nr:hypothetical protein [Tessaracoccus bendigoensis]
MIDLSTTRCRCGPIDLALILIVVVSLIPMGAEYLIHKFRARQAV